MIIVKTQMMKNIYKLSTIIFILFSIVSCEDDGPTIADFVTFESDVSILVPNGETVVQNINIYGNQVHSNDRIFNIEILDTSTLEPASYTLPNTVTIPANSNIGSIPLSVQDMNIDPDKLLNLNLTSDNNNIYIGEPIVISVGLKCPKLEIVFDGYASETSVEIRNSSNELVYSFDEATYPDGTNSMSVTLCQLIPGDYTFTINDAFGDGLSYPEYGYYKMSLAEEVYFFNNQFETASETHQFTVSP